MEREREHESELIELGTASTATQGGPIGVIEPFGLRPQNGIAND